MTIYRNSCETESKYPQTAIVERRAKERSDREGYLKQPQSLEEVRLWEAEAAWLAE
jgi:hypothetical protein